MNIDTIKYINDTIGFDNNTYEISSNGVFDLQSCIVDKYHYLYKVKHVINIDDCSSVEKLLENINHKLWNGSLKDTESKKVIIKTCDENFCNFDCIRSIILKDIYIKPFYITCELQRIISQNNITFYQRFTKPSNYNENKKKYISIEDGFTKTIVNIEGNSLTINVFIDVNIKLPKMVSKSLGFFLIKKVIKDITSCIV